MNCYKPLSQTCAATFVFAAFLVEAATSRADYHTYNLLTVEWLVDSSDTILVIRQGPTANDRELVEALKETPGALKKPLRRASQMDLGSGGTSIFGPPTNCDLQLHFIKGDVTLQAVGIGREVNQQGELHVQQIWYGVTQYGELLLTPSDLIDAIRRRIRADASEALDSAQRLGLTGIGEPFLLAYAGSSFPFESTDEMFQLAVPATTEWRDYYIQVLKSGDAAQRLDAITKLKAVGDCEARSAIRSAQELEDVPIGYRQVWQSSESNSVVTAGDVRAYASGVSKQKN